MENGRSENDVIMRALLHDLANPLALILSAVACLEDDGPDMPSVPLLVSKIKKAALEQKTILDTFKALRAFFKGNGSMELAPVNLDDVAEITVKRFQSELEAKDIDIEFAIEDEEDATLLAEAQGFQTIVMNALVSNALRFSPRGGRIVVKAKRNANRNEIHVTDSGVGMPQRVLDNLFDLTKRIRMPDLEGKVGLGLGLPILKKYLDRCDATILVESRSKDEFPENHGTNIIMSFKVPQDCL